MENKKINVKLAIWGAAGFGFAIWLAGWLLFGKDLPRQVPLWYSRPWGEAQLSNPKFLIILPGFSMLVAILTNWIVSKTNKGSSWQLIFGWSGVIAEIVLTVALLRIWILVI